MTERDQSLLVHLHVLYKEELCVSSIFCQNLVEREQLFLTVVTQTSDLRSKVTWREFKVEVAEELNEMSRDRIKKQQEHQ